jgi:uncharacterized protein (DUF885 family)
MMRPVTVTIVVFAALMSTIPFGGCVDRGTGGSSGATGALYELFDDEWQDRVEDSPLFATAAGDHRYNDRLDDVSTAAFERREAKAREFLQRLDAIDRSDLTAADRVHLDIFRRMLDERIAGYEFKTHLMPVTNRNGFHISFVQLPDRVPLEDVGDYENYIARLAEFELHHRPSRRRPPGRKFAVQTIR